MDRVIGMDVFHGDGDLQLGEAVNNGVQFLFAKSSDGGHTADSRYQGYRDQAQTVGLLFGAYHFFEPSVSPIAQAEFFFKTADPQSGDLILALDVEVDGPGVADNAMSCATRIQELSGSFPFLYSGLAFYKSKLEGTVTDCPLWIARYNTLPPDVKFTIWQNTDNAREPGTPHPLDGDLFFGTLDDLKSGFTL